MPAAIIQNASLPQEKMAIGTAAELQEMAKEQGLSHPAIIIIGEVVGLSTAIPVKKEGYRTDCEYQPPVTLVIPSLKII